jgi:hypothetical protein
MCDRMDFTPQMMAPIGAPSPQIIDQTLNMSPMDLFDSIFWGQHLTLFDNTDTDSRVAEPYSYGGMDQLGFDYNQPLYPQF